MAVNHEVVRLRAEALAKQRAVTKKLSRLKQSNGIALSGSQLDPRKSAAAINKLNARQLNAQIDRLENFIDRKTQYVPDKAARPVNGAKWRTYKSLERSYNKRVNDNFDAVANVKLPSGRTIGERFKVITPENRAKRGIAVNAPYDPPVRESTHFKNEKALDKMIADMRKRIAVEFPTSGKKAASNQLSKMDKRIKDATKNSAYRNKDGVTLRDAMKDLTPEQFKVLWNYTTFSTDISIGYEEAKKLMEGKKYNEKRVDNHGEYAHDLIAWAKKLKL